jgi:hypothetical protein
MVRIRQLHYDKALPQMAIMAEASAELPRAA